MYARIKEGFLEEFVGSALRYTKVEDGTMYYIQIINPTEKEFNDAGYYRVCPDEEDCLIEKAYVLEGNSIVKRCLNEKKLVQQNYCGVLHS